MNPSVGLHVSTYRDIHTYIIKQILLRGSHCSLAQHLPLLQTDIKKCRETLNRVRNILVCIISCFLKPFRDSCAYRSLSCTSLWSLVKPQEPSANFIQGDITRCLTILMTNCMSVKLATATATDSASVTDFVQNVHMDAVWPPD